MSLSDLVAYEPQCIYSRSNGNTAFLSLSLSATRKRRATGGCDHGSGRVTLTPLSKRTGIKQYVAKLAYRPFPQHTHNRHTPHHHYHHYQHNTTTTTCPTSLPWRPKRPLPLLAVVVATVPMVRIRTNRHTKRCRPWQSTTCLSPDPGHNVGNTITTKPTVRMTTTRVPIIPCTVGGVTVVGAVSHRHHPKPGPGGDIPTPFQTISSAIPLWLTRGGFWTSLSPTTTWTGRRCSSNNHNHRTVPTVQSFPTTKRPSPWPHGTGYGYTIPWIPALICPPSHSFLVPTSRPHPSGRNLPNGPTHTTPLPIIIIITTTIITTLSTHHRPTGRPPTRHQRSKATFSYSMYVSYRFPHPTTLTRPNAGLILPYLLLCDRPCDPFFRCPECHCRRRPAPVPLTSTTLTTTTTLLVHRPLPTIPLIRSPSTTRPKALPPFSPLPTVVRDTPTRTTPTLRLPPRIIDRDGSPVKTRPFGTSRRPRPVCHNFHRARRSSRTSLPPTPPTVWPVPVLAIPTLPPGPGVEGTPAAAAIKVVPGVATKRAATKSFWPRKISPIVVKPPMTDLSGPTRTLLQNPSPNKRQRRSGRRIPTRRSNTTESTANASSSTRNANELKCDVNTKPNNIWNRRKVASRQTPMISCVPVHWSRCIKF